jgi:peptide/nickel transport system permease protein
VALFPSGTETALEARRPDREEGRRRWPPRHTWLVGRVLASVGTLAFVLVFNFFLFRVLPGDPARNLTRNRQVPAEQVEQLRADFGLDQPLLQQFVTYLGATLRGELGISFKFRAPVAEVIADRLWPTLLLVGTAILIASVVGVAIGIKAGWDRGGTFDRVSTGTSLTLYSMPEFWLGLLLLAVFAVGWGPIPGVFPTGGLITPGVDPTSVEGVIDIARHLVLPVTTLALAFLAEYAMVMRSSLLDEMGEDYLVTARAIGLRDAQVRRRHAVPNAMLPTTTLIALNLGFVVSGAITVETVFSIPGLGLLTYEALRVPDYPLLQGLFLVFSVGVILANLAADLLYGLLDPRVRQ